MCFSMYSRHVELDQRRSRRRTGTRRASWPARSCRRRTGPRKMNEPLGRFGSFRPARVRRIAWRHGLDGVLLADDPLVQLVLHAEQLGGLLLGELVDGDAGPEREHLGDRLLVDLVEQVDARGLDLGLLGRLLARAAPSPGRGGWPASSNCCSSTALLLASCDLGDLVLELLVVGRRAPCAGCAGGSRPRR